MRKFIDLKMRNDNQEEVEEISEEVKEEKMGFFERHKKGLIFGGLTALTAGIVGLIIANKDNSDDYDNDYNLDLDDSGEETESDEGSSEA